MSDAVSDFRYRPEIRLRLPTIRLRVKSGKVIIWSLAVIFWSVAIVMVLSATELMFPDAGLWTRIINGNDIANQNYTAHSIMENSKVLLFTVAGKTYRVEAPNHLLNPYEHAALFAFAGRKGYPIYALDGVDVIDP